MAGSQNTTTLPLARLPRWMLNEIIEAALAELDARDGDCDMEPEEDRGELDHLPDDSSLDRLDWMEGRRYVA